MSCALNDRFAFCSKPYNGLDESLTKYSSGSIFNACDIVCGSRNGCSLLVKIVVDFSAFLWCEDRVIADQIPGNNQMVHISVKHLGGIALWIIYIMVEPPAQLAFENGKIIFISRAEVTDSRSGNLGHLRMAAWATRPGLEPGTGGPKPPVFPITPPG